MTALGAQPVRMAAGPELAEALRSGALDGLEGTLATLADHGLLAVQGCLALTGHVVMTLLPVMHTQGWHLLRAEEQAALQDALRAGGALCTRMAQERERALHQAVARHGELRVTRPERAAFRRALEGFYASYRFAVPPSVLAELGALTAASRAASPCRPIATPCPGMSNL